jgi:alpha-beta hydrolase superfamily lysophospholipase
MAMNHREDTFKGGVKLFSQCWRREGELRAVLAIVHGFGEHCGRYMNLVRHFVPQGVAVHGFDLRGHGRSPG